MGQLAKRGYDVSHSRPFKATKPGTRPNDKSRALKAKQPGPRKPGRNR